MAGGRSCLARSVAVAVARLRSTLGLDSAEYWVVHSTRPLLRAAADVKLADLAVGEDNEEDEDMEEVDYMDEDEGNSGPAEETQTG